MEEEANGAEKEHEPTQKRLDDARRKGEVPQSADLTAAASYAGFLLACLSAGEGALKAAGQAGATLLAEADRLGGPRADGATGTQIMAILVEFLGALAPFFIFPAVAALLALLAQRALSFAPEKLLPRLSRLSPIAGFSRKFGREGLFEFAKSAAKLVLVSVVLGLFVMSRLDQILGSTGLSPGLATAMLMQLAVAFLCLVVAEAMVVGGIDLVWQRAEFRRRNRMSRQELIDEMKQSEGDPHMKSARRARGHEIATNRMLLDVPKADVIVVNPTHYAVALAWKRGDSAAPVCIAKGVDEVAARIRASAAQAGVPIHSDPPIARALHATVDIGAQIRPEHYRAVAAAIRFAEAMRARKR